MYLYEHRKEFEMKRRFLAAFLAAMMVISAVPLNVLAEEEWASVEEEYVLAEETETVEPENAEVVPEDEETAFAADASESILEIPEEVLPVDETNQGEDNAWIDADTVMAEDLLEGAEDEQLQEAAEWTEENVEEFDEEAANVEGVDEVDVVNDDLETVSDDSADETTDLDALEDAGLQDFLNDGFSLPDEAEIADDALNEIEEAISQEDVLLNESDEPVSGFVTELTLSYNDYYSVKPGESVQLTVTASSPDQETPITFAWEIWVWDGAVDYWQALEEGVSGNRLTITPVKYKKYRCVVTQGDQVKYAVIEVDPNNHLYAQAVDDKNDVWVIEGGDVDLEVEAGCDSGELSYAWTKEIGTDEYEPVGENNSILHLSNVTDNATYHVAVSDEFGSSEDVRFRVKIASRLVLEYNGDRNLEWGATDELTVNPITPDATPITYQWQYRDPDTGEYIDITDATGSSYTTPNIPYKRYRCIASQGRRKATASFTIHLDTDFQIAQDNYKLSLSTGSTVTLQPEVTGRAPIRYTWYKGYVSEPNKLNGSDSTYTVTTAEPIEFYYCVATDGFKRGIIIFVITDGNIPAVTSDTPENAETIRTGETKPVHGSAYLKYVPETDGCYVIYSRGNEDPDGYLLDSDLNTIYRNMDVDEVDYNFRIEGILAGGETYYIYVEEENGNASEYYVTVEFVCDIEDFACDHVSDSGKVTKPATCVAPGEKTYTCTICRKVISTEVIPATGVHTWSAWTTTKAATCTAAGTQTRTCSVCKKTETQTIAATGKHTAVAHAAVAPTCTAAGKTAGSKCSVCGTVITAQKAVPATGHRPVAVAAVAATCTAAGKTAGSKCSVCGTVISVQQTVPALGHKWDTGKVTKEPTVAAEGVKTYTCSVCGATKTEAIPKLTAAGAQKIAEGDPNDSKSVAGAEKAMTAVKDNGEPKGSSFSTIHLYSSKQTKNSITLKWNKVKGASGYIIYGNKCGSKNKLVRLAKQTKNSFVYKKLKKGTYYKFTVAAYKSVNGKEEVIGSSKMIHVATSGGKVTNVKKVTATVKKKAVKKLALKAKKSATVAAKETLQSKKLTLKRHRKIKYESSNTKIAKVSAKGKITAKKKGKCFIYVYSQSGVFAKITLTVK